MAQRNRFSQEVRERAVRMVVEHERDYASQWEAIRSIAEKIGCSPESLRKWLRRTEVDSGLRDGVTSDERARMKDLEKENRELRRANEIIRKASAYFAQAELDRRPSCWWSSSTTTETSTGSSRSAVFCRSPRRLTTNRKPDRPIQLGCLRDGFAMLGFVKRSNASGRKTDRSMEHARLGFS